MNNKSETIGAWVVLKDGKIISWKCGIGVYESNIYEVRNLRIDYDSDSYTFENTEFTGSNIKSLMNQVKNWMRQWPVHEDFDGFRPYEDTSESDVVYGC